MRQYSRLAAVSALALAIAACSSPAEEEAAAPEGSEEAANGDIANADAETETLADSEGEAEDPTEGAEDEPTPEESAAPTPDETATPEPEPAAVMAPPAAFGQCAICHSVESGSNGIGPSLAGVVGRRSGDISSFTYSPAMNDAGLTWNEATLDRFLGDPAGVVPNTSMALPGIPADQRSAIIAYLKTL